MLRRVFISFALFCGTLSLATAAEQDDPRQTGPLTLIIQYKCLPAQRTQFRQRILTEGLRNFDRWQSDGILSGYHLLFSRYVDTNAWDLLALVTFRTYADVQRWHRVEAQMPAGLPSDAISLTSSVETYPADLVRRNSSDQSPARPVYLVMPYSINVPPAGYLQYFDDYVRPQFEGSLREGVLTSYQVFTQRYGAARPWDTLALLAYKDDESFGQREKVVAKVREQLQNNPAWKAAADSQEIPHFEKQAIIADDLAVFR